MQLCISFIVWQCDDVLSSGKTIMPIEFQVKLFLSVINYFLLLFLILSNGLFWEIPVFEVI